jgi:hypothetical protein
MAETIKMHCNEEMREHVAFVLRRHADELVTMLERTKKNKSLDEMRRKFQVAGIEQQIALTAICLKEATEAGT